MRDVLDIQADLDDTESVLNTLSRAPYGTLDREAQARLWRAAYTLRKVALKKELASAVRRTWAPKLSIGGAEL